MGSEFQTLASLPRPRFESAVESRLRAVPVVAVLDPSVNKIALPPAAVVFTVTVRSVAKRAR